MIYHAPTTRILDKGQEVSPDALAAHLREGYTVEMLRDILAGKLTSAGTASAKAAEVPLNVLPQDVQAMAKNLDSKQVSRMFDKMLKKVQGYLPGDASAARDLLAEADALWQSPAGLQVIAFIHAVDLPWREPDFITVRDAYQLHLRRQQRPNATLYPGDAEAMGAVPDALTYRPIYGGKTL